MTDLNTRMPPGSDVAQRTVMKPAFSNDLLDAVLHRANLQQAWKQVRASKGAAGIDGMTIEEFPAWVKTGHWTVVQQSIRSGDYQPTPVRRVEINKPDGDKRQLGIPTVTDRVIQQAIAQILMPLFDPEFSADKATGSVRGETRTRQCDGYKAFARRGRRFTVDVDCRSSFDWVNHDLLRRTGLKGPEKCRWPRLPGTCELGLSITSSIWRVGKVYRKVAHCHLCWLTSCSIRWIKNWNGGAIGLPVMRMTSPLW